MALGDKRLLAVGDVVGAANERATGARDGSWGIAAAGRIGKGAGNEVVALRGEERASLGS